MREEGFGARGVSLATTSAVVISSVLILVVDYVLTSFLL
jgi:phospholipid/cholesterol/gamma-HCH transport system permease protein